MAIEIEYLCKISDKERTIADKNLRLPAFNDITDQ